LTAVQVSRRKGARSSRRQLAKPRLDVFVALADPTRRDLLDLLREGDRAVNELAEHFDVTRPAISQQLRILREHGLVVEERVGRHRFYSLRAARLKEANAWLAEYAAF